MRQVERYVMVELLRVFGGLITISTLLLVFVGVFGEARKFDLGIWQVLQIMPYVIPSLMPYTIPATLLLSVCVVYGRMAGDNEIIAVRAAGIHIMHLMWPSFFIAGVLSIVALFLTDQIIPWAFGNIERIVAMAIEDIIFDKLRTENQINDKDHGISINVTGVRGRTLIHPTIRYTPPGGESLIMQAKEAQIEFDVKNKKFYLSLWGMQGNLGSKNTTLFVYHDRIPQQLPSRGESAGNRVLRTQDLVTKIDEMHRLRNDTRRIQAIEVAFAYSRGDFDSLNSINFQRHQRRLDSAMNTIHGMRTEYYNRFAMSVSCLFFVLLGSPFAILMAKKQFLTCFLFCFLPILTVYYPISMMTQNMAKSGQIDPIWSAWMANLTLLLAGLYFIRRVMMN
ncbi:MULTISPECIES: LptF/LptG family permease [unclassified Schlesneria]|uniref:LptF/LptG family permease n=1 Tax=Schlesneria TaxID=656899 RepID=UPI002EF2AC90